MPWMEMVLSNLTTKLATEREKVDAALFAPGRPVAEAFARTGVIPATYTAEQVERALTGWPASVAEAFKAAIHAALTVAPRPGHITVTWAASYDYGLEVRESVGYQGSPGGVTITLHSRYPFDPHPARKGSRARS